MNRKSGTGVLIFAVMAAIGGYALWQKHAAPQTSGAEQPPASKPSADTLRYEPNAPQLSFLRVEPVAAFPEPLAEPFNARITYDDNRTARVLSPVTGRVLRIAAEPGQRVRVGDPLLWIDSPDYGQAASDSAKAESDLRLKKDAAERAHRVYAAQGMALKELESAEADLRAAEAEAQRTRARLKNLGAEAGAAVNNGFALRAPVSGVVSERKVSVGSDVSADNGDPLFVITDPSRLWALIDLPEQQIAQARVGQPVEIEVDAFPGEQFPGRVTAVSGAMDPVTRRIPVRCEIENTGAHKLMPEMYARIVPAAKSQASLPRVPNAALFTQGLYSYLFIEQSPGVFQRHRVAPGRQGAEFTWIKDGLKPGERIVTTGALLLNSELSGD